MNEEPSLWIPAQTTHCREMQVAAYYRSRQIECYVPMACRRTLDPSAPDGVCRKILVPAVHNLVFLRHPYSWEWCLRQMQDAPFPLYFIRRTRTDREFCTVPHRLMQQFMLASHPDIEGTRYVDSRLLQEKRPVWVEVIRKGPLCGLQGQFIRFGGRHYIAIMMPHTSALLRVSHAWCRVIDRPETEQEIK